MKNLCLPCLVNAHERCRHCKKKFCYDCWDNHFHFEEKYTVADYIGPVKLFTTSKNNRLYMDKIKRFKIKKIDEHTYLFNELPWEPRDASTNL